MHEVNNYLKELGLYVSVYSWCIMSSLKNREFEVLINVEKVLYFGKSRYKIEPFFAFSNFKIIP